MFFFLEFPFHSILCFFFSVYVQCFKTCTSFLLFNVCQHFCIHTRTHSQTHKYSHTQTQCTPPTLFFLWKILHYLQVLVIKQPLAMSKPLLAVENVQYNSLMAIVPEAAILMRANAKERKLSLFLDDRPCHHPRKGLCCFSQNSFSRQHVVTRK